MSGQPFPVSPHYTSIAVAYKNKAFIADKVMPRVPVMGMTFKHQIHTRADRYTIPDTKIGRLGAPKRVEFSSTEASAVCAGQGLEFVVPQEDINQARGNAFKYDPVANHVEGTAELVELDREKRVADIVFAAASYATANKVDVNDTAADQWDNYTDSDPIAQIMEANDGLTVRANKLVLGRAVATKLRQHPAIIAAAFGNGGNAATGGIVSLRALADILELDEIIVGEGWYNTAKPGQTQSDSRLWGKHAALLYLNPQAMPQMGITFGLTAQYGSRIAGTWQDKNAGGLEGGTVGRVGEYVKELVLCNDAGYFFENAID